MSERLCLAHVPRRTFWWHGFSDYWSRVVNDKDHDSRSVAENVSWIVSNYEFHTLWPNWLNLVFLAIPGVSVCKRTLYGRWLCSVLKWSCSTYCVVVQDIHIKMDATIGYVTGCVCLAYPRQHVANTVDTFCRYNSAHSTTGSVLMVRTLYMRAMWKKGPHRHMSIRSTQRTRQRVTSGWQHMLRTDLSIFMSGNEWTYIMCRKWIKPASRRPISWLSLDRVWLCCFSYIANNGVRCARVTCEKWTI